MAELYPICRSITGDGVRQTLEIVGQKIPIKIYEVPTGTSVLDWKVPKEWNIRDAWVKNEAGERVVDFRESNLHVVGYSAPINRWMAATELKEHMFSLPGHPDWIPYRTSYYNETWGFCVTNRQFESLTDTRYQVCIDSTLTDGSLTYAECFLPGKTSYEVLFSTHICHPSLCNDNLSGISVATYLAKYLEGIPKRRYSYRILFIPSTIGSITWLERNRRHISRIRHGLVITNVGDAGGFTYKKSRQGDVEIDRVVEHVLMHTKQTYTVQNFFPYGYDERQFCSPGFNLPMGCLMRTPNGKFPEYHTSADSLEFVKGVNLAESLKRCIEVIEILESNRAYVNQFPYGEPQLGRRGLYHSIGGDSDTYSREFTMLWVLNLSDGEHTLLDIAELANQPYVEILKTAQLLESHGLLVSVADTDSINT